MASNGTDTPTPLSFQLNESMGAVFLGLVISATFFGVTNVQAFLYYQKADRDPQFLKGIIFFLWCLDALHLVFASDAVYTYLITNFTNVAFTAVSLWSLCSQVIVSATSDLIVQLCYCRRLWIMSHKNKLLTGIAVLLTVLTFAFTLAFGIKIFFYKSVLDYRPFSWALYAALGTAVVTDLWIALSLCYFLAMSKTGWKATDTTATRLMVYIVNTGLLTSIVAVGCFATYAALPTSYIYIAFYFSYSKLYFNALLAMLNARVTLRGGSNSDVVGSFRFRSDAYASSSGSGGSVLRMSRFFSTNNSRHDRNRSQGGDIESHPTTTISIDRYKSDFDSSSRVDIGIGSLKRDSDLLTLPALAAKMHPVERSEDSQGTEKHP